MNFFDWLEANGYTWRVLSVGGYTPNDGEKVIQIQLPPAVKDLVLETTIGPLSDEDFLGENDPHECEDEDCDECFEENPWLATTPKGEPKPLTLEMMRQMQADILAASNKALTLAKLSTRPTPPMGVPTFKEGEEVERAILCNGGPTSVVKHYGIPAVPCQCGTFVELSGLRSQLNAHGSYRSPCCNATFTLRAADVSTVPSWKDQGLCEKCGDDGEKRPGPSWWCRNGHGMIF